MHYIIVRASSEKSERQKIAGPFATVRQLIDALDTLLTHYSKASASTRYVWWIEEHATEHQLIIEELPKMR